MLETITSLLQTCIQQKVDSLVVTSSGEIKGFTSTNDNPVFEDYISYNGLNDFLKDDSQGGNEFRSGEKDVTVDGAMVKVSLQEYGGGRSFIKIGF